MASIEYDLLETILVIVIIESIFNINGIENSAVFEFGFIAITLVLLTAIPHEMLHAVCLSKGAVVEIYSDLKHGIMMAHSNTTLSKKRFIFMSFCLI